MHITLSFRLELSKEDKQKVLSLMKMQSSSVRTAYNIPLSAGGCPDEGFLKQPHANLPDKITQFLALANLVGKSAVP